MTNACASTTDRARRVPVGEVGPDPAHRLGEHARVAGRVDAQRLPRRLRLEVRDPVQRNGSVLVGEHHGPVQLGDRVRRCSPPAAAKPANAPSRGAESWLPGVIPIVRPLP